MKRLSQAALQAALTHSQKQVADLTEKYNRLVVEHTALQAEHADLKACLEEYEHRLKKMSHNSGMPPSSDGLRKPKASGKKPKSKRPSGGQPGHDGVTKNRSDDVDYTEDHYPTVCAGCGGSLTPNTTATVATVRQVQDVPEWTPLEVTDHMAWTCHCETCGVSTTGDFPVDVKAPVQYGRRLNELAVYLGVEQMIPLRRISHVIAAMTGTRLSQGTIYNMIQSFAQRFQAVHTHIGDLVKHEPVTHFDETGMRVDGSLNWMHTAGTETHCYYWLGTSRGDVMEDATGIAVHDHWPSYLSRQPDVHHAFCLAHLVRECKGLAESGETWAKEMTSLLYEIIRLDQQGSSLSATDIETIETCFDDLVQEGLRYHNQLDPLPQKSRGRTRRRPGHNLALRFFHYRDDTLRCLHNPLVPATNNLAERDIRPLKIKQKISGSFRTKAGAQDFAVLRSVLETARKRQLNALDVLGTNPSELMVQFASEAPPPDT